jgi:hypothetical protein
VKEEEEALMLETMICTGGTLCPFHENISTDLHYFEKKKTQT